MSAAVLNVLRALPIDAHGRLVRELRNILRAAPTLAGVPVDTNRDVALGRSESAGLVLRLAGSTQHDHGVSGQPTDWDTVVTLEVLVRTDAAPLPASAPPDAEGGADADPVELALRLHAEAYAQLRSGLLRLRPDVSVSPMRIEVDADHASERIGVVIANYVLLHRTPHDRLTDCAGALLEDSQGRALLA